LSVFHIFY